MITGRDLRLLLAISLSLLLPLGASANTDTGTVPLPAEMLELADITGVTPTQIHSAYPALVTHRDALLQEFSLLDEKARLKHKHRQRIKKHDAVLRTQLKAHMTSRQARRVQQMVTAVMVRLHTKSSADLSASRRPGTRIRHGDPNSQNYQASPYSPGVSTWTDTHVQNADGTWSNPEYYPRQ